MANVNIKFNGKEYLLSCEDGQEDHLIELSENLNNKFSDLKNSLGNIGESKLLLITSIKIFDEYFETRKKIKDQKDEINNLKDKFKELKNLVYNYKNYKDAEINSLSKDQLNLKKEIENNKINYANMIEKTTHEIENFIKKNDASINS